MIDLKNLLTEEQARKFLDDYLEWDNNCSNRNCDITKDCVKCYINKLKQAGIIRQSAEAELIEYVNELDHKMHTYQVTIPNFDELKELILAFKAEMKNKIKE